MAKRLRFSQAAFDFILRLIWAISLLGTFVLIVLKVVDSTFLESTRLEYLMIALLVFFVIPYLGRLEAFGIKVEIRKVVEDLDARVKAIPDYILGVEYYREDDIQLAEICFQNSLNKDPHFWPAKLQLGAIAQDKEVFFEALNWYQSILKDEDTEDGTKDIYAHNNLADLYLYSEDLHRDPQKALDHAIKTIELCPGLGSGYIHKAEALNRLRKYTEALPILRLIIAKEMLPSQDHWVNYELMLANAWLLNAPIEFGMLETLYRTAVDNNDGKYFLKMLTKEKVLYPARDHSIIDEFLSKPSF
jgi:tetratricopeptide (TPR) repeat protein